MKSIWSKITGLSDEDLELETWDECDVLEKSALEKMINAEITKEECSIQSIIENEAEIFVPSRESIESNKGFLGSDESWSLDSEGQLGVDVYRDGDNIIVKSAIAGVKQKDLEITISNDTVTIAGSREEKKTKIKEKDYFYQECYWGKFSRSVVLPFDIDEAKSKANLEDGILTVTLPIVMEEQKTKIKIKEKK
ncbi:MAG: Hsp20/alpha crystallin family protein [Patescibacteria group bacterium]